MPALGQIVNLTVERILISLGYSCGGVFVWAQLGRYLLSVGFMLGCKNDKQSRI